MYYTFLYLHFKIGFNVLKQSINLEIPPLPEFSKNQDISWGWFTQSKRFYPLPKASWREYQMVEYVHYCMCFWHSQY